MNFDADFELLTDHRPFPWQRALYRRFVAGDFPSACDLPTGLGKTSVLVLWLLALVENAKLPRRLVYVVNRRTVVDQATTEAERLAERLQLPQAARLREALRALASVKVADDEAPLAISTLRGERADNAEWRRDPSRPAIVVGTVDMIGSRLLFSGYGCGFKSKPLHAGFLGQDVLLVHDEAHLEPAFQSLLVSIREAQTHDPRPLRVLALSATGRGRPDFTLTTSDEKHEAVEKRLTARKGLRLHEVGDRKDLPERVAEVAAGLEGRILVFLSAVEHVEKCAGTLRKMKKQVQVLTGTMRGAERDALVETPIFARFLPRSPRSPRSPEGASLAEGTVYLVATSAGEVGIDISADHLVTDLPPFDALAQRLGRVNRYGEGDALVEVLCEPLKAPPQAKEDGEDEEKDDKPARRKDELEWARFATRALLAELRTRRDGRSDASPEALRSLPIDARRDASTPEPECRAVDDMLFDRWSYTTITKKLPGRPPVEQWLHGVAEWEPPRTTVAWRREVAWLSGKETDPSQVTSAARSGEARDDPQLVVLSEPLEDFLADYPLRSRETLSDRTDRVVKHLERIAARDTHARLNAWLLHEDTASSWKLAKLLEAYDSKRNPLLDGATVILPPEVGGLNGGLLDGDAEFVAGQESLYDLGPKEGERIARELDAEARAPDGMRLVRTIRRETSGGNEVWWQLCVRSRSADDDGSRTSREQQLLEEHLARAERWAKRLTERLHLPGAEADPVVQASGRHDDGKDRRVWQRSIKNNGPLPLAKGTMQPSDLGHYRHELGSLCDAVGDASFANLTPEGRDLALHLIAAHHGRARPHFPRYEAVDPERKEAEVASVVEQVPLRFDRLQRKYGRWGLAWLESLVRVADYLASDDEEELS